MARDTLSFARKKPRFQQMPTVLVVCEDSKSNKKYIEDAAEYFRAKVDVLVEHCGKTDPLNIVNHAINESGKYDIVFCVIDRDTHKNFDQAIYTARSNKKIKIIDSHPCFEYWYLLHFNDNTKPYTTSGNKSPADNLIKDLKKIKEFDSYDKGAKLNTFQKLLGQPFENAKINALRTLNKAIEIGDPNPSTRVHELMEFIIKLKDPKPIKQKATH